MNLKQHVKDAVKSGSIKERRQNVSVLSAGLQDTRKVMNEGIMNVKKRKRGEVF